MGDKARAEIIDDVIESAITEGTVTFTGADHPEAVVKVTLDVRRQQNSGRYEANLCCDPSVAEDFGRLLIAAAKAARGNAERYRADGQADA